MQIETLVLYSVEGAVRTLNFRLGELNIITGDSQTGKSSLTNIFRYCLGSSRPGVPLGPISETVVWYGLVVRIGESRLFLGRPAAGDSGEVSAAMLLIEPEGVPAIDDLESNTTADDLREYLAARIGIEENANIPIIGQTRPALAANFVHSLYYCFQSQGEVANPTALFHRQNLEWQPQAIRDTLPYFLGAQGLEELRLRQRLTDQRRRLRAAEQRLSRAQAEDLETVDRAHSLLVEAQDAALLQLDDDSELAVINTRSMLQSVIDQTLEVAEAPDTGAEFDRVRVELGEQRQRAPRARRAVARSRELQRSCCRLCDRAWRAARSPCVDRAGPSRGGRCDVPCVWFDTRPRQ